MRESRKRANGVAAATMSEAAGYVLAADGLTRCAARKRLGPALSVLVADLFTISARMEIVREHLGRNAWASPARSTVSIVASRIFRAATASASARWRRRCMFRARLSRRKPASWSGAGFLAKRTNPLDRRGVLFSVAPAGRLKLDGISHDIRAINDLFFGELDARVVCGVERRGCGAGRTARRKCDTAVDRHGQGAPQVAG